MHRPGNRRSSALVGLVLLGLLGPLAAACGGGGGEQQFIQKYFMAAKVRDTGTLGNIATVSFSPDTDGVVQKFKVVSVTPDETTTLRLAEFKKALDEATAADEDFSKKRQAFEGENGEAIQRIIKAEGAGRTLGGRDGEIQAQWTKWREDAAATSKKVSDARKALSDERSTAEVSVFDPQNPIDVTAFDTTLTTRKVTIEAQVDPPGGGERITKNMVITLSKADLKSGEKQVTGRWIITSIVQQ